MKCRCDLCLKRERLALEERCYDCENGIPCEYGERWWHPAELAG